MGQGGLGVSTGGHRPGVLCDEGKTTAISHDPNTLINGYHLDITPSSARLCAKAASPAALALALG